MFNQTITLSNGISVPQHIENYGEHSFFPVFGGKF